MSSQFPLYDYLREPEKYDKFCLLTYPSDPSTVLFNCGNASIIALAMFFFISVGG